MSVISILEEIFGTMPEDNTTIQFLYYVFGFVVIMYLLKVLLFLFSSICGINSKKGD